VWRLSNNSLPGSGFVDRRLRAPYRAHMITPEQCRAARGLLKWTQRDLADAARVSKDTIRHFELEQQNPQQSTLAVIQRAFEDAGVEFTNGDTPGLRLHKR